MYVEVDDGHEKIEVAIDSHTGTVLPAKSDSDVMFVYKVLRDLQSIDQLCINPIRRIGLIHKWSID